MLDKKVLKVYVYTTFYDLWSFIYMTVALLGPENKLLKVYVFEYHFHVHVF